jgi:hypothetical protein
MSSHQLINAGTEREISTDRLVYKWRGRVSHSALRQGA